MMQQSLAGDTVREANISSCGQYRYCLSRRWRSGPMVCFVMLNPSTADGIGDDATIRRLIGFSKSWGYGSLVVVNLFAYRATDPRDMKAAGIKAVGPENDHAIEMAALESQLIVAAWGAHGSHMGRDRAVLKLLGGYDLMCLARTKDGQPKHPVRLPGNLEPTPWRIARCS